MKFKHRENQHNNKLHQFFFAIPKDQSSELVSTNVTSFSFISSITICACLKTWATSLNVELLRKNTIVHNTCDSF